MSDDDTALVEAAHDVSARAYARYSKFRVGAAVRDESGRLHVGCNVENAAYPEGICAETNAIGSMIAAGGTRIVAIAVWADSTGGRRCTPCGGCRQRISEFADENTRVVLAGPGGEPNVFSLDELLPESFRL